MTCGAGCRTARGTYLKRLADDERISGRRSHHGNGATTPGFLRRPAPSPGHGQAQALASD